MGDVLSLGKDGSSVKGEGRWAPLRNVQLCSRALERALNREPNLPGIVAFTGYSGLGKSMAASYCANKFDGFYVECRSYFTKKNFVEAILKEMGIRPARTVGGMMEQAAEQLDLSQRPLIVDEFDHALKRAAAELVRDLHEMARATILLIGEENMPRDLLRLERFHNRVLVWELAQPCSTDDVQRLANYYCPGIAIDADLQARIREASGGVARRVCVNLDMIRDLCQKDGTKKMSLADWGKRAFYSGNAPQRVRNA
jgi:hypothetical protein